MVLESSRLVGSWLGLGDTSIILLVPMRSTLLLLSQSRVQTCVRVHMERPETLLNSLLGPGGGSGENPVLEILCLQRTRLNCDAAARSRAQCRLVVRVVLFFHLIRSISGGEKRLFFLASLRRKDATHVHGRWTARSVSCSVQLQ